VSVDFHLLTSHAASDVILDKDHHTWPPIVMSYEFEGLELTGVSRGKSVVIPFYDPFT
jgi:hypothetical protein